MERNAGMASLASATGQSLAMTLVSELGDETFIIAALLAMRQSKWEVLAGALGAMYMMTILSATLGWMVPKLLTPEASQKIATVLFFAFSAKLLWLANETTDDFDAEVEEIKEQLRLSLRRGSQKRKSKRRDSGHDVSERQQDEKVKADLARNLDEPEAEPSTEPSNHHKENNSHKRRSRRKSSRKMTELDQIKHELTKLLGPVAVEAFVLCFLAEWGDRSQIATITLAADQKPAGVVLGGVLGHTICSTLAVFGGEIIGRQFSQRTLLFAGSAIFFSFGAFNLLSSIF